MKTVSRQVTRQIQLHVQNTIWDSEKINMKHYWITRDKLQWHEWKQIQNHIHGSLAIKTK